MPPKRTVHRIQPNQTVSFDQQFWPVLVALIVLCSLGIGAIITILDGPWMWFGLLVLPMLAFGGFFLLYKLDDSRLRRSLQLAIILSLATHLAILLFSSIIGIFNNPYEQQRPKVAVKQNRTITIADRTTEFVWQEPNAQETPETPVEVERQQAQTEVRPQPVPMQQQETKPNPQLTERKETQRTVPRLDQSLSQLRRQTQKNSPQSSVKASVQPSSSAKSESKPKSSTADSSPSASKTKVERQSAKSAVQKSETKPEAKPEAAPKATEIVERSARAQRQPTDPRDPAPQQSASRLRRTKPSIAIKQNKAPIEQKITARQRPKADVNTPVKSASEVTRRPTQSNVNKATAVNRPDKALSQKSQIARSSQRRNTPVKSPSISQPDATSTPVRRSTRTDIAVTSVPVEQPNPSPTSKSNSRELNPKTLSITRSTAGVAGIGRSSNMDRSTGGAEASPAVTPSDSASRRRSESKPTEMTALSSLQSSTARRSIAQANSPTSSLKAEQSSVAKLSGSKAPSQQTVEASAANVDSSSNHARSEVNVEKGSANVDVGATKIVKDQSATRRSGGGQPEFGEFNPQQTQRSSARSARRIPTLDADIGQVAAAPSAATSAPSSANELEASQQAAAHARTGGESDVSREQWEATEVGDVVNQGSTNLEQQLADARSRASSISDRDGALDDDDDDDDELQAGNQRTRLSQSPNLSRESVDMGIAQAEPGGKSNSSMTGEDEGEESVAAEILQRGAEATSMLAGSRLSSATRIMAGAAASLPLIDSGDKSGSKKASANNNDSGELADATGTGKGRSKAKLSPKIEDDGELIAANESETGTGTVADDTGENLEPTEVTVQRSDRASTQGAMLEIDAMIGPAGLESTPTVELGSRTRPASKDSEQIQPEVDNRFRSKQFGGAPAMNPDAVLAKEAFSMRNPGAMSNQAPSTEAAIQLGLEFLARYQQSDGSWALTIFDKDHPMHRNQLDSDSAGTGLALLAFQGAGYNHREFKYARQMSHAIDWLVENQTDDGCLYVESNEKSNAAARLYSHGIAALALTEAYGMTQDPQLKEPAQKAIDYIAKTQHKRGGWRYYAQPNMRSTDTSVSGWMMMALKSGQLAGLETDAETYINFDAWMRVAADKDNESLFRYNPYAIDKDGISRIQGRKPSPSMTAVGLLMKMYGSWEKDDERLRRGADWLIEKQMPSDSTSVLKDTYYWYYATQVMKHMGGEYWEKWNGKLHPLLVDSQQKSGELAGSWDPYGPVPDRWGSFGGRLYVTTMNLLSLEVRYRLLPLYDKTVSDE